ncbi:MAG: LuxR C-terminal-related transcriptional regulator [Candidatus Longimicrobiales bacterium M2_2A_002]
MRVLALDRSRSTCEGLAAGLGAEEGVEVRGTVFSVEEALGAVDGAGDVDVVVTTMNLGEAEILELARTLRDRDDGPGLVVAGLPPSPSVIARYLEAGVDAYLTEEISIEGLGLVLSLLDRGEVLIPPPVAFHLVRRLQGQAGLLDRTGLDVSRIGTLTDRERDVLEEIAAGASNQEIADRLFIEVGTVKSHVHAILKKLDVAGRREARRLLILHRTGTEPREEAESASL